MSKCVECHRIFIVSWLWLGPFEQFCLELVAAGAFAFVCVIMWELYGIFMLLNYNNIWFLSISPLLRKRDDSIIMQLYFVTFFVLSFTALLRAFSGEHLFFCANLYFINVFLNKNTILFMCSLTNTKLNKMFWNMKCWIRNKTCKLSHSLDTNSDPKYS